MHKHVNIVSLYSTKHLPTLLLLSHKLPKLVQGKTDIRVKNRFGYIHASIRFWVLHPKK